VTRTCPIRRPVLRQVSPHALVSLLSFVVLSCLQSAAAAASPSATSHGVVAVEAPSPALSSPSGNLSIADYVARLRVLDQLVASCQAAIGPANCRSDQVGADVSVALPSGSRQIRFNWLRQLFNQAAKAPAQKTLATASPEANSPQSDSDDDSSDADTENGLSPKPLTITQRLQDARSRLKEDQEQAEQAAHGSPLAGSASRTSASRATLNQILASKEYHAAVAKPTLRQRILEKIANWLNKAINTLVHAGAKSKWIGITAEIGFVVLVCVALVWFLIRLERRGRMGPLEIYPGSGAVSARDWQLWLQDARQAARSGSWRDAIHLLYWASISRLESTGLWPADRARTPREYLALLPNESQHRPDLTVLTRSFERTWYANNIAAEGDFLQAEQSAHRLGVR
jgi:Domain of unknown function (DUF4129)/Egg-laying hormone precursor